MLVKKGPHPDLINVATDPRVSRQAILLAVLEAIRNSGGLNINGARRGGAARKAELNPDRVVVAKEKHDDGRDHYHVAVRFSQKVRWQSICGYLRYEKRLPSHFSLSHTSWWSALRY